MCTESQTLPFAKGRSFIVTQLSKEIRASLKFLSPLISKRGFLKEHGEVGLVEDWAVSTQDSPSHSDFQIL